MFLVHSNHYNYLKLFLLLEKLFLIDTITMLIIFKRVEIWKSIYNGQRRKLNEEFFLNATKAGIKS